MPSGWESIADRLEVEDAVVRLFVATDARDWPAVESCFTDPFVLDMSSMSGGGPVTMTPRQVSQAWADGFKALDHVHHQVGNLQTSVEGHRARVRCHGVAFHHRAAVTTGARTRAFVGTYEIDLVREGAVWLIRLFRFNLEFVEGNLELEKAD